MFTKAHTRFSRHLFLFIALTSGLVLGTFRANAATSPLHLSLTEVSYDHARGRLALTVRVQTADFEAALSARAQRKITTADPGEFAPLALDYVRDTLHFKSPHGEALRLEWAGLDVTSNQVFLFFETTLAGGLQGSRIANTLLQERIADQINSVEVHDGALKQTIVFSHDTGEVVVNAKL